MPVLTGKTKAQVDTEALTNKKTELIAKVDKDLSDTLQLGFDYNGVIFQADERAQSIALGAIVMDSKGLPVFPYAWRNKANEFITFQTVGEFMPFSAAMGWFVTQTYSVVFAKKDGIRKATTVQEAQDVYDGKTPEITN